MNDLVNNSISELLSELKSFESDSKSINKNPVL